MLIGEAVLKSPAFSPRLNLLVQDLRAAGCTVWLEGLRLRFDLDTEVEPDLAALLKRYRDVVEWSPEPRAEFSATSPYPRSATPPRPKRFAARDTRTKQPLPLEPKG